MNEQHKLELEATFWKEACEKAARERDEALTARDALAAQIVHILRAETNNDESIAILDQHAPGWKVRAEIVRLREVIKVYQDKYGSLTR